MSYEWTVSSLPYWCGITPRLHTKTFHGKKEFFNELYYHSLIQQQGLKGFLPIAGYCLIEGQYTVYYHGQKLSPGLSIRPSMMTDLVSTVKSMADAGHYYVNAESEALFWDPVRKQVVLADYQFFNPYYPAAFTMSDSTSMLVKQLVANGLLDDVGKSAVARFRIFPMLHMAVLGALHKLLRYDDDDVGSSAIENVGAGAVVPPPLDIETYLERQSNLLATRFHSDYTLQSDEVAHIQVPPKTCDSGKTPVFPFVGKVYFHERKYREELRAALMADLFDPDGKYHARLGVPCQLSNEARQLVYEYTGRSLTELSKELDYEHRFWFYTGLLNLLRGFQLFHDNQFVHGDVNPKNITSDPFFNLKLIDYGLSGHVDDFSVYVDEEWGFPFHSVELKMVKYPEVDVETLERDQEYAYHDERFDELKSELFELAKYYGHARDYWTHLRELSANERQRVIVFGNDLYGLGVSLLTAVLDESVIEELKPVLYHLVSFVWGDRDLTTAIEKLEQLIALVRNELAN